VSSSIALLLELGVLLIVLSVLGTMARSLSLPPVPLYLLAGLAVGEGALVPVPASGPYIQASAKIGLVLLLLMLGLEFSIDEFAESLRRHVLSVVVDTVLNATPGAVAGLLLRLDAVGVLALAGVTWMSSSGIVARLLGDMPRLRTRRRQPSLHKQIKPPPARSGRASQPRHDHSDTDEATPGAGTPELGSSR
jgi:CPA2 family monovalent cation:H+ antiporter-2